ncbi:MAG TPA: 30S ribosomal protein S30e [Candidatus Nitrosocosmicus sp.]|nr:30S ribosomal protein S30e [Candidatus Nitrosocosmicus sp.]
MPVYSKVLVVYNKYEICSIEIMPTHGSLTKAGKVRGQTPKIRARERTSPSSKVRNKNNFVKRFEKRIQPGQKKPERMHRR